jgi:hypothetical protein
MPILAKDTDDIIGGLDIFTTETIVAGKTHAEIEEQFFLPEGVIKAIFNYILPANTAAFERNRVYTTTIEPCSNGDFLGSIGVVTVTTGNTRRRKVKIVFYKAAIYPLTA